MVKVQGHLFKNRSKTWIWVPYSQSKSKALFIYLTLRGKRTFNLFGKILFRKDLFIQSLLQGLLLKYKDVAWALHRSHGRILQDLLVHFLAIPRQALPGPGWGVPGSPGARVALPASGSRGGTCARGGKPLGLRQEMSETMSLTGLGWKSGGFFFFSFCWVNA